MTAEAIGGALGRVRSRYRLVQAGRIALAGLALGAALSVILYHVDRVVVLGSVGRASMLGLLALTAVTTIVLALSVPALKSPAKTRLAAAAERRFPDLAERLLSVVELDRADAGRHGSPDLIDALRRDVSVAIRGVDLAAAIPLDRLRGPALAAVACLAVLGAHIVLVPGGMGAWFRRVLHPAADIPVWAATRVWVKPGDAVVPRGDGVVLTVITRGGSVGSARVWTRSASAPWQAHDAKARPAQAGQGVFALAVPRVDRDFEYYARAGDGKSNTYTVRAEDRPTVRSVSVRLTYPEYTGRAPSSTDGVTANVVAPVGTVADILVRANKPLARALAVQGSRTDAWAVASDTASAKVRLLRDATMRLSLTDRRGFRSAPDPEYVLRVVPDKAPTVRVIEPTGDVERSPLGSVSVQAEAIDDYGVREFRVAYRSPRSSGSHSVATSAGASARSARTEFRLNLGSLGLRAGDALTYWVEALDGDNVSGPNRGRSSEYRVRIVSSDESRDRARADIEREQASLKRLVAEQRRIVDALSRPDASPQVAAAAAASQRAVASATAQLRKEMDQSTERMRDNGAASASDLARRAEASAELASLASAAMPRASAAMDQASRASTDRAAQTGRARDQAAAIHESLQRLAGRSGQAQSAAQLAREAAALAGLQMRLADDTETAAHQAQAGKADERAQRSLADRQADLRARTSDLAYRIDAAADPSQPDAQAVRAASQAFRSEEVPQKQSQATQALRAGQPAAAVAPQMAGAAALQRLAANLSATSAQQTSAEALGKLANALDRAADKLTELAGRERGVQTAAQQNPARDEAAKLAGEQRSIDESASALTASLAAAPAALDAASRARAAMERAAGALARGEPQQAATPAREATRNLLEASMEARDAARLLEAQEAALRSQKAIESLAREQRALERRTAAEQPAVAGLEAGKASQRAGALAQEQDKLVNRTYQAVGDLPGDAHRTLGRLSARRMEDARAALWQRDLGAQTRWSQAQAARMLDRLAVSLEQQRLSAAMEVQAGNRGSPDAQIAEVSGAIRVAREMQAQVRADTAGLDARRESAPNRAMDAAMAREASFLAAMEGDAEAVLRDAANRSREALGDAQSMAQTGEEMREIRRMLEKRETDDAVQRRQGAVIASLDRLLERNREQMAQAQRRPGGTRSRQAQAPRSGPNDPARPGAPVVDAKPGLFMPPAPGTHRFGGLSAREQMLLQQGRQDQAPVEYRDLVGRYYRALSERRR